MSNLTYVDWNLNFEFKYYTSYFAPTGEICGMINAVMCH